MAGPWDQFAPQQSSDAGTQQSTASTSPTGPWAQFAQPAPTAGSVPPIPSQSGQDALGGYLVPAAGTQSTMPATPAQPAQATARDSLSYQALHSTPSDGLNAARSVVFGTGIPRGLQDVADTIAQPFAQASQWVDNQVPALKWLDQQTGLDPTAAMARATQDRSSYEQQYGNNPADQVGRVGGQILATAPIMGMAGRAITAGADALGPTAARAAQFFAGGSNGSLGARVASQVANGTIQGGTNAALTSSQSSAPLVDQIKQGAEVGAVAAPVANLVANGAGAVADAPTGAGAVDPARAALAQIARDQYGIPITAPQISTSPLLKVVDSQTQKIPFSGAGAVNEAQQGAFTRALSNTFGEDTDRITPAVMDAARARIGQSFNNVAQNASITADPQFVADMGRIAQESAQAPLGDGGQNAIRAQIDNILGATLRGNGTINGNDYQTITRFGAPLDRTVSAADPNVRYYGGQIREALDDALQRSTPQGSPLLGQLQQARQQWRGLKTSEDLVEKSTDGQVSPALLMGRVRSAPGQSIAYGTGGGDLGNLARIGQAFFKAPADSNTATRTAVDKVMTGVGAGVGGLLAGSVNPLSIVYGAAGGGTALAANRALGNYLRGPGLANRMITAGGGGATPNPLLGLAPYAAPVAAQANAQISGSPVNPLARLPAP